MSKQIFGQHFYPIRWLQVSDEAITDQLKSFDCPPIVLFHIKGGRF